MNILFFLLLFVSLLLLVIGLISPKVLAKVIRVTLSRKKIGLIFTSSAIVFFILFGVFTPPIERQTTVKPIAVENSQPEGSDTSLNTTEVIATTSEAVIQQDGISAPIPTNPTAAEKVTQPETKNVTYAIVSVTDGDTFKVSIDGKTETVRAIGIDTPETVDPRKPVQCFGVEASKRAKVLLTGKRVKLQADPTQDNRDKYSRLLRYAWLEDGTFFNLTMVADGYAVEYTYQTPYQYQQEFKRAEADARTKKLGLWADNACPGTSVNTNTNLTPVSPPATSGHIFYTSSYSTTKYYYCDTDENWKTLQDSKYLKSFSSAEALLKVYPSRKLHEPCK
ncbi:MAG: thermonuclease family protein [Candidatus Komeilibacteria bacterium]